MAKIRFEILILLSALCLILKVHSQDLLIPIAGVYVKDYIIVNYPDWHITAGPVLVEDGLLNDFHCGSKTYDGIRELIL